MAVASGQDRVASECYDRLRRQPLEEGRYVARIGESGELCKCSFCGRGQSQVQKLTAGPGVYICDDCIDLCCEMLDFDGVPPPRRYNVQFDLQVILSRWVDGITHQGADRTEEATMFLEGLLARLRVEQTHKGA